MKSTRKVFREILAGAVILASTVSPFIVPLDASAATRPGYIAKILFETTRDGNREIYSMNADGSNQTRLTNAAGNDMRPQWSPDGSKVVFESNRLATNNYEIFIMNADGSNQTNLTNIAGNDRAPQWSPDGSKILFMSTRGGGNKLYTMNPDGGDLTLLVTDVASWREQPQWSPDGSKILFRSTQDGNVEIYTINADGSNQTRLTNTPHTDEQPRWSPDGTRILYMRYSPSQLWVMDADGQNNMILSAVLGSDFAEWSPDGSRIVFFGAGDNYNDIFIENFDTLEVSQVTDKGLPPDHDDSVDDYWPQWTPDGRIIFQSWTPGYEERDLFIINTDGSNKTRLHVANDALNFETQLSFLVNDNLPPIVTPDALTAPFNTPTLIDVLANDTDEEPLDGSNLSIVSQPAHGSVNIESGKVKYRPILGYQGADSFTYQICDSFMLDQKCSAGTVDITVLAPTAPSLVVTNVNGEHFSAATNKYTTTNLRPTFSGTATPGAEIKVEIHSDPITLTTTADGDGNWSVTPSLDLPSGEHMVYVSATLAGFTTEIDAFGLTVGGLASTGVSLWMIVTLSGITALLGGGVALASRLQR